MARILPIFASKFIILFSILSSSTIIQLSAAKNHGFARSLDKKILGLNKKEKLTHFKVYWHDIVSGRNPTSVQVVTPKNTTSTTTGFGIVSMIDDPITAGPELSSKMVGISRLEMPLFSTMSMCCIIDVFSSFLCLSNLMNS